MTTTGCDLASIARDAETYYTDLLREVRVTLAGVAEQVRGATLGDVVNLVGRLDSIATQLDEAASYVDRQENHCHGQFSDAFEEIRKQWHEAVDQRANSMHDDCYSSESVQDATDEAVRCVKRNLLSAIKEAIDEAEAY